ncbi:MAG TPA: hypothetical protein PLA94_02545, partial [Myxococcota bacterium]|nr:hypothetical protein [Myxococcota bacterium]
MSRAREDLYRVLAMLGELDRLLHPLPPEDSGNWSSEPSYPPPVPTRRPSTPASSLPRGGPPPGSSARPESGRGAPPSPSPNTSSTPFSTPVALVPAAPPGLPAEAATAL